MLCRDEIWLFFSKSLEALSINCTWCFLLLASIPILKRPHIRRSWRRQCRASNHHWLRNENTVHRENVDWLYHNQIVSCKTRLSGWTSLFSRRQCHNPSDTQPISVVVFRKYAVPAAYEALIWVSSTARPQKDTLALIEPRIIPAAHEALRRVSSTARPQNDTLVLIEPRIVSAHTLDGMPQDEIQQSLIIARTVTVTHWCSISFSAYRESLRSVF